MHLFDPVLADMLLPQTSWADSVRMKLSVMAVDMSRHIVFISLLRYVVILVRVLFLRLGSPQ